MNIKCVSGANANPWHPIPTPRAHDHDHFFTNQPGTSFKFLTPAAAFAPFGGNTFLLQLLQLVKLWENYANSAAGFANMLICICLRIVYRIGLVGHRWPCRRLGYAGHTAIGSRPSYALKHIILPVFFTPLRLGRLDLTY